MNREQFVESMRDAGVVAAEGVMQNLRRNPPLAVYPGDVRRGLWFQSLSAQDQAAVEHIVHLATRRTVFAVLRELDGIGGPRTPRDGRYDLHYRRANEDVLITGRHAQGLHDMYRAVVES